MYVNVNKRQKHVQNGHFSEKIAIKYYYVWIYNIGGIIYGEIRWDKNFSWQIKKIKLE